MTEPREREILARIAAVFRVEELDGFTEALRAAGELTALIRVQIDLRRSHLTKGAR